jgi:hypothetical protein
MKSRLDETALLDTQLIFMDTICLYSFWMVCIYFGQLGGRWGGTGALDLVAL